MAELPMDLGRAFEDFRVGDVIRHATGRTVLDADNVWFTLLTVNPNPIHFDRHLAARTEWGRPLVDSTFTLALVTGLTVADLSRNGVNLGWDEVRLPAPVFEGDTIYAQSEILEARASRSRPRQGIVRVRTEGFNQDGTVVISFTRTIMVTRREHLRGAEIPPIRRP